MIKYLGSKRRLLPQILAAIGALPDVRTVLDLFSGSARVAHACKHAGYRAIANDHCRYAAVFARCYVTADADLAPLVRALLSELSKLPAEPGWFTETYCQQGRYLMPHNGARVEAIREAIARRAFEPLLEAVLLTSLLEAADRVDSTTGVQMAFLKQWAPRARGDLELRVPDLLPRAEHGNGEAHELEALEAATVLAADVAYLDPPYNQHKYLGNYHVWETLARWDRPPVFGVAQKRIDCKTRGSAFNSSVRAGPALQQVIDAVRCKHVVVSFSDEGWLRPKDVAAMLQRRGPVFVLACDNPRYVGARIGIHNLRGEKVGAVSHLRNREFLFVATEDAAAGVRLCALGYEPANEASALA